MILVFSRNIRSRFSMKCCECSIFISYCCSKFLWSDCCPHKSLTDTFFPFTLLKTDQLTRKPAVYSFPGPGLATSASSHALGECSPPLSPITMSHTTPSIYPGNMGTHNSFQPSSIQSTYLPSNVQQNPTSSYNTSPYNTYQSHSPYTKPNTMMGTSLSHHNTSLGNTLGQTSSGVLGTNLTSNLQSSIGGNFGGE